MATVDVKLNKADVERLLRKLKSYGPKMERKYVRKALSKAGTIVARDIRKRVPKGSGLKPDGTPRKHLKQTIKKTTVRANRKSYASIRIGPEAKAAPHSHLVEFGTQDRYTRSGAFRGRAPEQSFMRTGFKSSRIAANQMIASELRKGLEQLAGQG